MKVYCKTLLLFLLLSTIQVAFAVPAKLTNFRFTVEPGKTRLVFDTSAPINYTAVDFPDKVIIDIKNAKLASKLEATKLSKSFVESIADIQNKNDLRLIVKLKNPIKLQHFVLKSPNRLVLDLQTLPRSKSETKEAKSSVNNSDQVADQEKLEELMGSLAGTSFAKQAPVSDINRNAEDNKKPDKVYHTLEDHDKNLREIVIVIDPGHGGTDSGAIGCRGTKEKNVTLAVSKELQRIINKTKGFRAVLTRKGDYFVPLRQRLNVAHNHKADMFISIHADAYVHNRACGASVFALSQRGATSEAARWLAQKENESELGQTIFDKNAMLRSVLIDLAQTATIGASLEAGGMMLGRMGSIAHLHSKRIEQAAFVVLKSPDIPSLLVELGFLSHRSEEKMLRDSRYQRKIADSLASGIKSYFIKRPPRNTYLAKLKR